MKISNKIANENADSNSIKIIVLFLNIFFASSDVNR